MKHPESGGWPFEEKVTLALQLFLNPTICKWSKIYVLREVSLNDYFFTFTQASNQKKHFGMSAIKKWVDSKAWILFFPDYQLISIIDRTEIKEAVCQASGVLLQVLRNWQEVCKLLIVTSEIVFEA